MDPIPRQFHIRRKFKILTTYTILTNSNFISIWTLMEFGEVLTEKCIHSLELWVKISHIVDSICFIFVKIIACVYVEVEKEPFLTPFTLEHGEFDV